MQALLGLSAAITSAPLLAIIDLLLFHFILYSKGLTTYEYVLANRQTSVPTLGGKLLAALTCRRWWPSSRVAINPCQAAATTQEQVADALRLLRLRHQKDQCTLQKHEEQQQDAIVVDAEKTSEKHGYDMPRNSQGSKLCPSEAITDETLARDGVHPPVHPVQCASTPATGFWGHWCACMGKGRARDSESDMGTRAEWHATELMLTASERRDVHAWYWLETGISLEERELPRSQLRDA
jgi:hypothetical protein